MENILNLGKLIEPIDFYPYINEADKLEHHVHKYGTEIEYPDYPCWLEYKNEGELDGSISLTRNTYKHPILQTMCQKICDILTPILDKIEKPNVKRVHFIKTYGSIPVHKDEGGRISCINIGIKNSSKAITRVCSDRNFDKFETNSTSHKILEGYGYLLNINQWHSIESDTETKRYLITYSFGLPYFILKNRINLHNGIY